MAWVNYFMTPTGAGSLTGTSEANAYGPGELASITDSAFSDPTTAKAALDAGNGVRLWVKTGTYDFSLFSGLIGITRAGAWGTGYLEVRGYVSTPGDLDALLDRDDWRIRGVPADVLARMPLLSMAANQFGTNTCTGVRYRGLRVTGAHTTNAVFRASATANHVEKCVITSTGAGGWAIGVSTGGHVRDCVIDMTAGSGSPASGAITAGVDDVTILRNRIRVGRAPAALSNGANSETVAVGNVVFGYTGATRRGLIVQQEGVVYVAQNLFDGAAECVRHQGTGAATSRGCTIERNIALMPSGGKLYSASGSPTYPAIFAGNVRSWADGVAVADDQDDVTDIGALAPAGSPAAWFSGLASGVYEQIPSPPWTDGVGPFLVSPAGNRFLRGR